MVGGNTASTVTSPFVLDNSNVLAAERALYIPQGKSCAIPGCRVCLRDRSGRRPAEECSAHRQVGRIAGIVSKYRRLQMPNATEGFYEVPAVTIDTENRFVLTTWLPTRTIS